MRLPTQTVIQMYQDNLFRIAFSICQNREDAEDVVQETFLRYHSGAVDFNDEMHIRAWLIRVTINQSKNMLRTFWHRNRTSLEDYMEQLNFSDTPFLKSIVPRNTFSAASFKVPSTWISQFVFLPK